MNCAFVVQPGNNDLHSLADVGEDESYFVMGDEHTATNKLDKYLMKKDYNQEITISIPWL